MSPPIKLSWPATRQFWEIPVLYEDDHLLALNKPPLLLTSPVPHLPGQPSLMNLLHTGIAQAKPWAKARGLAYLANAHRLDFEASGVLLLARSRTVLIALAELFGSEKPYRFYVALVHGAPQTAQFECDAKLGPDPSQPGRMRVDPARGKRSRSQFEVIERFVGYALVRCVPLTDRPHQVRVHLQRCGFPVVGDQLYGGHALLLSTLKPNYRLKPNRTERPLIAQAAVHLERIELPHPVTGAPLSISAPWPKDLTVAVKYLRRFATPTSAAHSLPALPQQAQSDSEG